MKYNNKVQRNNGLGEYVTYIGVAQSGDKFKADVFSFVVIVLGISYFGLQIYSAFYK
jgi:hypothetical protein